ncbi:transposase [Urbifossiella limnaea]|uniref:transposase n=1 Tax=Urbifossiella limnaea TaxID=2528023 RepID=UPI0011A1B9B3|nr:transposase [Urbifossiella limnaea]
MANVTRLHPELRAGDVLVGDRAFGTYAYRYFLVDHGLHGVFRMSQRRVVDFTPGRSPPPRWNTGKLTGKTRSRWVRNLGPTDQVVEWYKPYQRQSWMTAEAYAALPVTLAVRETQYAVNRPGFRVGTVTLVSTLPDETAYAYPAGALAELYRQRWQVETDLAT